MPRVSVILCAYNAERFLASAVRSILVQTFTDFELIAIDDGSKDATAKILDDFAAGDPRVRVIHQTNTGQVQAAMNGIAASSGPLIARMDADDIAKPDRFAKQVAFFDAHPEVVLLGGAYEMIDERGRLLTTIPQPADDASLQNICLTGRCPICQPLAMFRRDAYEKAGGYRPPFNPAEDLDLWLRIGEIGQMACLPDVLLQYRQHANSLSEAKQSTMIDRQRETCRQAWERRNIIGEYKFEGEAPWRATGEGDSRYRQLLKYGWWAWNSGENRTARSYGWSAVHQKPFRNAGWKLIACGWLKRAKA